MTTDRTSLAWTAVMTAALQEEAALSKHLTLAVRLAGACLAMERGGGSGADAIACKQALQGLIKLVQYGGMSGSLIRERIAMLSKQTAYAPAASEEWEALLLESVYGHRQSVLGLLRLTDLHLGRMAALWTRMSKAETAVWQAEKLAAELLGSALSLLELIERLPAAELSLCDAARIWADHEWQNQASAIVSKCRSAVFRDARAANEFFALLQHIQRHVPGTGKAEAAPAVKKSKPAKPTIFIGKRRSASLPRRTSRE